MVIHRCNNELMWNHYSKKKQKKLKRMCCQGMDTTSEPVHNSTVNRIKDLLFTGRASS